jgi:hypothetical protein
MDPTGIYCVLAERQRLQHRHNNYGTGRAYLGSITGSNVCLCDADAFGQVSGTVYPTAIYCVPAQRQRSPHRHKNYSTGRD